MVGPAASVPSHGTENTRFIVLVSLLATLGGFLSGYASSAWRSGLATSSAAFVSVLFVRHHAHRTRGRELEQMVA